MSKNNYLRLGLILTVTGLLALLHAAVTSNGIMPRPAAVLVGLLLLVLGVPLLIAAVRRRPTQG